MLVLVFMLTGCSSSQKVTKIEHLSIPESLIPHCPPVEFNGITIGDLIIFNEELVGKYRNCRNDIQILEQYIKNRNDHI